MTTKKKRELEALALEIERNASALMSRHHIDGNSKFLDGEFALKKKEDFERAVFIKKDIKLRMEVAKEAFEPQKKEAFQAHREICSLEKRAISAFVEMDEKLESKLADYLEKVDSGELQNPGIGIDGFSFKARYEVEVVDVLAFLKAVLNGEAPAEAITIDMSLLANYANKFGDGFKVDGVTVKKRFKTSIRLRSGGEK